MHLDHTSLLEALSVGDSRNGPLWLSTFDQASDGLWYWNLDHPDQVWMSPRLAANLGVDPRERRTGSLSWPELLHPDDLSAALAALQRHLEDPDESFDVVVRCRGPERGYRWIRARGSALPDGEAHPFRMFGTHTDVTELMEAKAALEQKAAELQLALDEVQRAREQVRELAALVPVCAWCGSIRHDDGDWERVEAFITRHTGGEVSHGICPTCRDHQLQELGSGSGTAA